LIHKLDEAATHTNRCLFLDIVFYYLTEARDLISNRVAGERSLVERTLAPATYIFLICLGALTYVAGVVCLRPLSPHPPSRCPSFLLLHGAQLAVGATRHWLAAALSV